MDKLFGAYRPPVANGKMLPYGFDDISHRVTSMLLWKDVNRDGLPLAHQE
jgi:hypothetical protein